MIVKPDEYEKLILHLKNPNTFKELVQIPENEPVYEINLDTRTINAPEFLSVEEDHNSEIIWFKTKRFYDNFDISSATCWIQYRNALGEEYYLASPLIISAGDYGDEFLLIPWTIGGSATKASGTIEFSFQFFKLTEDRLQFQFILNTQSARSKILAGLRADPLLVLDATDEELQNEFAPQAESFAKEIHALYEKVRELTGEYQLYWTEA